MTKKGTLAPTARLEAAMNELHVRLLWLWPGGRILTSQMSNKNLADIQRKMRRPMGGEQ